MIHSIINISFSRRDKNDDGDNDDVDDDDNTTTIIIMLCVVAVVVAMMISDILKVMAKTANSKPTLRILYSNNLIYIELYPGDVFLNLQMQLLIRYR